MTEFYDGAVARAYSIIILFIKGESSQALDVIERELDRNLANFNNVVLCLGYKAQILAQLGRYKEAQETYARFEEHTKDMPTSFLSLHSGVVLGAIHFMQGKHQEAFDLIVSQLPALRSLGIHIGAFHYGLWLEVLLNAAEGLSRQKKLSVAQTKKAKSFARYLAKKGLLDCQSVGYRVLAVIAHQEGKAELAKKYIQQALEIPAINPYRRLLCLEAARFVGTPQQEAEVSQLTTEKFLVRPVGWS